MSTLIERLRIKAGVMEMGERIAWGSDTALMREAAGKIEALEAQLESVGAGGVGAMMPKQLAAACDECGATHRPGENTLCQTFRPQQIAEPAVAIGWKLVPLEPTAEMLQAGQDAPVSESDEDAPEDYKAVYRAMLAAAPQPQQIAEPVSVDEPGWICEHPQYGTWFISRAAIISDWKQDQKQAYPDKPESGPDTEAVDTWLNEQTSWIEISRNGKQVKRPDMGAYEAAWLQGMKRDVDSPDELRTITPKEPS